VQALLVISGGLLGASIVCVAAELATPGNAVVGTFGITSALVGALLAGNVGGSADAVGEIASAFRPGRSPARARPVRGVRVLGSYYVVFGVVLAVAGYGGFIHWAR
jgi:hypothetical protein